MKRLVAFGIMMCAASAIAMPSRTELTKVQPLVNELMNPLLEDFRAKKKSPKDVAQSAVQFAAEAEGEAAKFLLLKGAVGFYVRAEEYDVAADTVEQLLSEVKDVPPDVLAEIISRAASRITRRNAPRLFAQYRAARAQLKVLNDLKALAKTLKQTPGNLEARREYAELLAVSGDWKAALEQFSKLKDKTAQMAKAELDGKAKPGMLADFWWDYKVHLEEAEDAVRAQAGEYYRLALDAGELTGLKKALAEQRVEELKEIGRKEAAVPVFSASSRKAKGRTLKFEMGKCEPLEFVKCPAGTFMMGYERKPGPYQIHKVRISRDFYMATHLVTIKQWREFMPWETSWAQQEAAAKLPGKTDSLGKDQTPVCGSYADVMVLIGLLNYKYGDKLPKGYVFRLPTEAEWEYACKANSLKTDPYTKMSWSEKELAQITVPYAERKKMLKEKCGWTAADLEKLDETPNGIPAPAVGSAKPNAWGLYDMLGSRFQYTMDCMNKPVTLPLAEKSRVDIGYPTDGCVVDPLTLEKETSWVKYKGRNGIGAFFCSIVRGYAYLGRPIKDTDDPLVKATIRRDSAAFPEIGFRIVIGPDLLAERKAKYPEKDFGGKCISEMCRIEYIHGKNRFIHQKHMLDPQYADRDRGFRTFLTANIEDPYVRIQLAKKMEVVGLVVENTYQLDKDSVVPLMCWVSDDKKNWVQVGEDASVRDVYRFDLNGKKVSCRYIKIGRKPKASKNRFDLAKIMIYAK